MLDRSNHWRWPAYGWYSPVERIRVPPSGLAGYRERFDGMLRASATGWRNQRGPESQTDPPASCHSAIAVAEFSKFAGSLLLSEGQPHTARVAVRFCPGRSAQDRPT